MIFLGFNSLQTGKPIQSEKIKVLREEIKGCFNSLQTGKPIQSRTFQANRRYKMAFQFPSNGKAYPKERESLCRVPLIKPNSFNSLQTRKPIQRGNGLGTGDRLLTFQFPSNGKADPKWDTELQQRRAEEFQFPSNGKAYPKSKKAIVTQGLRECFNSLQTGKPIQRKTHPEVREYLTEFQFPSNGKAYPKIPKERESNDTLSCFNSLQTGKPIQSRLEKFGRACKY